MRFMRFLLSSSLANRVFTLYGISLILLVGGSLGLLLQYQAVRKADGAELTSASLVVLGLWAACLVVALLMVRVAMARWLGGLARQRAMVKRAAIFER